MSSEPTDPPEGATASGSGSAKAKRKEPAFEDEPATPKAPQSEPSITNALLREVQMLRKEHGAVLAVLEKMLAKQEGESKKNIDLAEITDELREGPEREFVVPPHDIQETSWYTATQSKRGSEQLFEYFMKWVDYESKRSQRPGLQTNYMPIIHILFPSGKTKTIQSQSQNSANDDSLTKLQELWQYWPKNIHSPFSGEEEIYRTKSGEKTFWKTYVYVAPQDEARQPMPVLFGPKDSVGYFLSDCPLLIEIESY